MPATDAGSVSCLERCMHLDQGKHSCVGQLTSSSGIGLTEPKTEVWGENNGERPFIKKRKINWEYKPHFSQI